MHRINPVGLQIRLINIEDALPFLQLIEQNRERLTLYFPKTLSLIRDIETTRQFINLKLTEASRKECYWFLIFSSIKNKLIGALVIKDTDMSVPKCELAYFIDAEYEGKGITSIATQWLVNYCFEELGMEKINIRINPGNEGSKRVALKNGFSKKGHMKKEYRNGYGELTDVEYYGLTKNSV